CIFNSPPPAGLIPTCQEAGVVGVLAGVIGTIQATEALKLILGIGTPLTNRLLTFDAQKMEFREVKVKKNPNCPVCGENPTIKELIDYEQEVCRI
ncbi:MAG: ThiF family adenylyltransferase, partial [Nitrospira sp.]|nr:ThiF family adenylyltransferase [Nitrospira sp.]